MPTLGGQSSHLSDKVLETRWHFASAAWPRSSSNKGPHARLTGLGLLAAAKAAVGELNRVEAVIKLLGMVNAEPDFGDHPKVINGCSDLFVEVLGEAGRHARSAVGMGSLPGGISVEIEAILLIRG